MSAARSLLPPAPGSATVATMGERGGRQRTGSFSAKTVDGRLVCTGRLRLQDGTKTERFRLQGATEEEARAHLADLQRLEDLTHPMYLATLEARRLAGASSAGPAETCDQWHARYLPTKECGEAHRRITGDVWGKWVSPIIGQKPIAALTRDDVEDVRDRLDRAIDRGEIRHSTAANAWGALTGAMKAAYASKDRTLRVHSAPICYAVLPPRRGAPRQRPWLYPAEWSRVVACKRIPIAWRQIYALALYTGLRPGELRALTWADVDLVMRTISVSKAWDAETKSVKPPKSAAGQRVIPIHAHLQPMLEEHEGEPGELVAPLLASRVALEDRAANLFREHLEAAGLKRTRLTADNATEEPIDFRSLRDSHATWLALAGVSDKVIQRRLGHEDGKTTDKYIKAAESLDVETIGTPFPPLPSEVWPKVWTNSPATSGKPGRSLVARVGFEGTLSATNRGITREKRPADSKTKPDTYQIGGGLAQGLAQRNPLETEARRAALSLMEDQLAGRSNVINLATRRRR